MDLIFYQAGKNVNKATPHSVFVQIRLTGLHSESGSSGRGVIHPEEAAVLSERRSR